MAYETHGVSSAELTFRLSRLGMSPEQFATEANLSNMTVRRHEQGTVQRPRRSTVRQMREALSRLEAQMEATKENPRWASK